MDGMRGRLALLLAKGITGNDWAQLEAILRDGPGGLVDDADVGALSAELGRPAGPVDWAEVDRQLAAMQKARATLVLCWDDEYPESLRNTAGAPPALFVRGDPALFGVPATGIVGTRKPSAAGGEFTWRLARDLAALPVAVVSGLARGIDTAAHSGALSAPGPTIAVLGTGVDVVYPPENRAIMERIAAEGAVVSEQLCGTQAFAHVFPKRNRIISGLSEAVVVVEGGAKSGALITAQWALTQGRDVGAVPGFPGDFRSEGPNRLLREGAFVVERAADVIRSAERLNRAFGAAGAEAGVQTTLFPGLDGDALRVYDLLTHGASADDVARAAALEVAQAQRLLAHLEIDGHVARDDGGLYRRTGRGAGRHAS